MEKGILFVISAPSGGGKSTLSGEILNRVPNLYFSISYTTRAPRKGEQHGREYFFVSEEEFQKKARAGDFVEHAQVHGAWYGTPKDHLQRELERGRMLLLDIDVQGGRQIKKIFPEAVLIFIAPPSLEVLEARLRNRHQDDEPTIQKRLSAAKSEIEAAGDYDYLILNNEIPRAVEELQAILAAERCRMNRRRRSLILPPRVVA